MAVDPNAVLPQADSAAPQSVPEQPQAAPDQPQAAQTQPQPGASGTADLENHIQDRIAARAANDADNRPKTGLFARILYGAMSHLEGAGKGLATGGIPGALQGAVSPELADKRFQQVGQMQQGAVDMQKADIANKLADAHLRMAQAANYPDELEEKSIEHGQSMAMQAKALNINPISSVDSPESMEATAHQLLQNNQTPMFLHTGHNRWSVYDWDQVNNSSLGLQDVNSFLALTHGNGGQPIDPQIWANPKFKTMQTQYGKASDDFWNKRPENLMDATNRIAQMRGIVNGINNDDYAGLPEGTKQRAITRLANLVEAYNAYLAQSLKLRQAPANARYMKVDLSDGSVTAMTGPQLQAASGQQQATGQANGQPAATPVQSSVASRVDTQYVKPAEDAEKSYQLFMSAYRDHLRGSPTGAQSMMALSQHLATTFGNVKGARVTRDMIQEHLHARSVSDDALVAVQKLTNGDVLSPQQWEAFRGLITESRTLSWNAAKNEATRYNVPLDSVLPKDLGGNRQDIQQSQGHKVGDRIKQGNKTFTVTQVDNNGKVLAAR